MPELLTQSGVMIDGRAVTFEAMSERLRREVEDDFGLRFANRRAQPIEVARCW